MSDLPYISFAKFSAEVPKTLAHRLKWDNLEEQEKKDLYEQVHYIIDHEFNYIGTQLNSEHAFPRDFTIEIGNLRSNCEQKKFLTLINRTIPLGLAVTCVGLARDILISQEFQNIIELRRNGNAISVQDKNMRIDFGGGLPTKYSREAMNYINQLRPIYYSLKV